MTGEVQLIIAIQARTAGLLIAAVLLTACAQRPVPAGANDPYETVNRVWFERNLALDARMSGDSEAPVADSEAPVIAPRPALFRRAISNFGANLGLPSTIVNDLLQIRPDHAMENTLRLAINSTIGLGGVFDPAGAIGLHGRSSDFGETLHRWGVGEGAYLVLPVLGPANERDALGMVVDVVINPLRFVLPQDEYYISTAARIAGRFADRAEFAGLLDANVINTADPYAQARLLFMQTRRYHLGIESEDEFIDPYADF